MKSTGTLSGRVASVAKINGSAWLKKLSLWTCLIVLLLILYTLSVGPVMRHYRDHPPALVPSVVGYDYGEKHVMVTFPGWVHTVYYPVFRLLGGGERSLSAFFLRYMRWWVEGEHECRRNLRQIDDAKRKWATETHKTNGDTAFVTHIIDYLPKRSIPKCPNGGEYRFNKVGAEAECSHHGYLTH